MQVHWSVHCAANTRANDAVANERANAVADATADVSTDGISHTTTTGYWCVLHRRSRANMRWWGHVLGVQQRRWIVWYGWLCMHKTWVLRQSTTDGCVLLHH